MHCASGIPTPREDEQADEEVQKSDNAKIIFNRRWFFGRLSYELSFELAAATLNPVMCLRPQPGSPQTFCNMYRAMDFRAVNRQNVVAIPDSCIGGWGIGRNVPGKYAARSIPPGCAVVRGAEVGALLKIDDSEDNRGQRSQGKNCRA